MVRFTEFWHLIDQDKDFEERGPTYHAIIKETGKGAESYYFWFLNLLEHYVPVSKIEKTKEVFASTESSAFWGQLARRRADQERRATNIMKSINRMLSDVHEIVRTLRKIDERLDKYEGMNKGKEGDEVALKDYWTRSVEGGTRNPSSIYGLAEKIGFATLPDLFFTTMLGGDYEVEDIDDLVEDKVDQYDIPEKVDYTLKRKLKEFLRWKERSYKELKTRKEFHVKTLTSMLHEIHMYTEWIKPYLRAIERMRGSREELEGEEEAALMTPFSTTVMDYEIVAWNTSYSIEGKVGKRRGIEVGSEQYEHHIPTVIIEFKQISKPTAAKRRGRQTAYAHPGKLEIKVKGRVQEAVEMDGEYVPKIVKEREEEDFDSMINLLSNTVDSSLRALKDDLKKYVAGRLSEREREALLGIREEEEKEEEPKWWEVGLFSTKFGEAFEDFRKRRKSLSKKLQLSDKEEKKKEKEKSKAKSNAETISWLPYKIFKKNTSWFETWTAKTEA